MKKEFKVGLLVVVAGTMLYLGFNFMKGKDFFTTNNRFEIIYPSVDGLTEASPVKYKGAIVGQVQFLEMKYDQSDNPERHDSVLVSIMVDPNVRVNEETVAILKSSNPLDGMAIFLDLGKSPNLMASGDRLKAAWEPGLIDQFKEALDPTIKSTEEIMKGIQNILDTTAKKNIGVMMENFAEASVNVKNATKKIDKLVDANGTQINLMTKKVNGVLDSTTNLMADLKPVVAKLNALADTLNNAEVTALVNKLNTTVAGVNQIVAKVNNGEGTIGELVNNKELHTNLNATILALNSTLIKLNNRPKDLFGPLGKKNQKFILDTVQVPHLLIEK